SCLMILANVASDDDRFSELIENIYLHEMRNSIELMLDFTKDDREDSNEKTRKKQQVVQVDDHLNFTQLLSQNQELFENQFELSLSQAIGGTGTTATSSQYGRSSNINDLLSISKLSKVTQLTGISDPVYSECYVNVNQYDICLDVLIVNQTNDTLQNC